MLHLVFLAIPFLAHGDGYFEAPTRIPNILRPVSMAAGDFNRDRKLDLAVVSGDSRITVLLQGPSRRDGFRRGPGASAGIGNFHVRSADFDGDGDDDLLVADPASTAYLLLSSGDGTFGAAEALPETRGARALASGDWNGDGALDIAAANHDLLTVSILLGARGGPFTFLESLRIAEEPHALEALDYDGDGRQDLMAGVSDLGLVPLRGKGDGRFEPMSIVGSLGCVEYLATGDFNKDGLGDLATTCTDFRDAFVGISLGNGTYRPSLAPEVLLGGGLVSPAIADLNGDGFLDLALTSTTRISLSVYPGTGDGSFLPPVAFGPAGTAGSHLLAADLDRDGRPDLVSAENFASALTIFWGQGGPRFLESARPLEGFPPSGVLAVADLDRDGTPDLVGPRAGAPGLTARLRPGASGAAAPPLTLETAGLFSTLEAVDLDGDGLSDLAGVDAQRGALVTVILGPSGGIRTEASLPAGPLPEEVEAGRIDEDETVDLAVLLNGRLNESGRVAVFLGLGGGSFSPRREVPTLDRPRDLALGDLDRDGRLDLAVVSTGLVAVHRGAGGGTHSPPVEVLAAQAQLFRAAAIAEVTGDGLPDLLVAETTARSILLLPGKGGGALGPPLALAVGAPPQGLLVADLDGDGLLDLTTSNGSAGESLSVLRNRGAGGFGPLVNYRAGFIPTGHRIEDLDLDGALDMVAYAPSNTLVFHGRPVTTGGGSFRRGDVSRDGRIQINDPILILSWLFLGGTSLACLDAADGDDDGEVAVTDAIRILSYLFLDGNPLPPPGAESCGEDPSADRLPACSPDC